MHVYNMHVYMIHTNEIHAYKVRASEVHAHGGARLWECQDLGPGEAAGPE